MTWLSPLAGLLLAAAVIPPLILLYWLKLRRRPQSISSTLLWKRSVEDLRANAPFQKLRKSLLLFLQLMALALLALAVMQPQIQAGRQKGGKTVILIDNSASMCSKDAAPGDATRLDEAKRRAKEKIESLYSRGLFANSDDQTMIVVFSDRAEIYSRFTDSKQQLLAAIDRIQPTHGESRIAEALKLARAYTTNVNPDQIDRPIADPATLELFSDGCIADLPEQVLRGEELTYHAIGSQQTDNVALGAISVDRPYDRPNSVEVFAALLNYNSKAVKCNVQLAVDNRARGIEEVAIPAAQVNPATSELTPGRANVVFTPFDQPRGALIEVAILREDDLAADNTAQIVVAPSKNLKVLLVAENDSRADQSLIRRALEGMRSLGTFQWMRAEQYEAAAKQGGLDEYDVIVLDNYKPIAMPSGRYLTFGPTPPIEGLNEYDEGKTQIVLSAKDDHPALRNVNYDDIIIAKSRILQPARDVQVLMEGSRGPIMLAINRGPMQIIHCAFDHLESTWPIRPSFVHFLVNAVEYLGHSGQALTSQSLKPGEAITARLPSSATDIQLLTPEGGSAEHLAPQDPTQLAWGPIRLGGAYVLSWKSPASEERQTQVFAVNSLSESEGRIDVRPTVQIGKDQRVGRKSSDSKYTPLWPWAVGVCLAVMMLEWWVYHRKAYI